MHSPFAVLKIDYFVTSKVREIDNKMREKRKEYFMLNIRFVENTQKQ